MARVSLELRAERLGPGDFVGHDFIRLRAGIQFVRADRGFAKSRSAIIDTGAPWCVLPRYVREPLEIEVLEADTHFGGVSKRAEEHTRPS